MNGWMSKWMIIDKHTNKNEWQKKWVDEWIRWTTSNLLGDQNPAQLHNLKHGWQTCQCQRWYEGTMVLQMKDKNKFNITSKKKITKHSSSERTIIISTRVIFTRVWNYILYHTVVIASKKISKFSSIPYSLTHYRYCRFILTILFFTHTKTILSIIIINIIIITIT